MLTTTIDDHPVARATRSHRHQSCCNFRADAPTSDPSATPCAGHQYHFLGCYLEYHRSFSRCNAARPNFPQPKLQKMVTYRPQPLHQLIRATARLKVKLPPLGRIDRSNNTAALATQNCHSSHVEPLPFLLEPLPAMVPKLPPQCTNISNPGQPPRIPPSTTTRGSHKQLHPGSPR